jgi:hypothetical protein
MARTEEAPTKGAVTGVNAAVSAQQGDKVGVFVRLRPLLPLEEFAGEVSAWEAAGEHGLRCTATPQSHGGAAGGPQHYDASAHAYDRVFDQGASSQDVYAGGVAGVVAQAMAGYHGTVFAYGQTVGAWGHACASMRPCVCACVPCKASRPRDGLCTPCVCVQRCCVCAAMREVEMGHRTLTHTHARAHTGLRQDAHHAVDDGARVDRDLRAYTQRGARVLRACVCAGMRACMRACVCVCVCACVRGWTRLPP